MLSTPILLIVVFSFLFFVRSLADVTIDPELSETLASNDDPVEDPYNSILAFDTTEQANGKEPVDGLDSKQVTTSDSGDETSLENLISIKNCPPDQQGKIRKARQLEECPSAFTTKEKTGTQSSRGWPRGRPAVDPKKRPEQRPAAIEKPVPKEDPERCPKEIFKESRTPVCHDGVLKQAAKIAGSFHLRNAHLRMLRDFLKKNANQTSEY